MCIRDSSKIEEQKKAVRSGYDMDIIPSDLATYGKDAKALLKELQSQNERMFQVTLLVMNTGRTEQEPVSYTHLNDGCSSYQAWNVSAGCEDWLRIGRFAGGSWW